jgi:hypothetical protein
VRIWQFETKFRPTKNYCVATESHWLFLPFLECLYDISCLFYTVMIFLARNGRIRAVKFRSKNFGRISFDLGEIPPNQQILRLNNRRNSPKSVLRANLNCADSPGSPEKISTVYYLIIITNFSAGIKTCRLHSNFNLSIFSKISFDLNDSFSKKGI